MTNVSYSSIKMGVGDLGARCFGIQNFLDSVLKGSMHTA